MFLVTDGSKTVGPYGPVANLDITAGAGSDSLTVDLNGSTYTGNLLVSTGAGNDSITILSSTGAGAILGNTNLIAGAGVDSINLNSTGTTAVRFGGSVQVTSTVNQGAVSFGNTSAASSIGKGLTITNFPTINLTDAQGNSADVVSGGLTINDGSLVNTATIGIGNPGNSIGTASTTLTINGNVNITTGSGSDVVELGLVTVNGTTNVNAGSGNDIVTLGQYGFAGVVEFTAFFNGSVTINHASGSCDVQVAEETVVSGNMNVQLGNAIGSDTNSIGSEKTGFVVYGNLSITGGNGNNEIVPDVTVYGNLNITLGNSLTGNLTVLGIPPTGTFNYTSGNGNDMLDIFSSGAWNANIHFGTGSDTVFLIGSGTITGSLTSQLPGNNTFNQTGWTINGPFYFNF